MERDYIFHEHTTSLCSTCKKPLNAKIIFKDESVYIRKYCLEHGVHDELLERDKTYFLRKRQYDKPSTMIKHDHEMKKGCPHDCGLCPQHDQHTCIGLIEITQRCNMACSMCYADSEKTSDLSLAEIEAMMDYYQEAENHKAEILQISGGEPTLHEDILEIIKMGQAKKIKYVMLNTNGLRIAEDEVFAEALGQFKGGFEVYLQFDGTGKEAHMAHRQKDVLDLKLKAIERLVHYQIPVTLVVALSKENRMEIGKVIQFAIKTPYIRGINFQPVVHYGDGDVDREQRLTLSDVLNEIEKQTSQLLKKDDFIPLPCNVERIAVTYMLKGEKGFIPVLRHTRVEDYVSLIDNTLNFDMEELLKNKRQGFLGCSCFDDVKLLKKLIPANYLLKSKDEKLKFVDENTFRITVTSFVDAINFDMKSVQKECVHVITKDLKRVPFSMYNLFHRR